MARRPILGMYKVEKPGKRGTTEWGGFYRIQTGWFITHNEIFDPDNLESFQNDYYGKMNDGLLPRIAEFKDGLELFDSEVVILKPYEGTRTVFHRLHPNDQIRLIGLCFGDKIFEWINQEEST